jgi:hypothetical protein
MQELKWDEVLQSKTMNLAIVENASINEISIYDQQADLEVTFSDDTILPMRKQSKSYY